MGISRQEDSFLGAVRRWRIHRSSLSLGFFKVRRGVLVRGEMQGRGRRIASSTNSALLTRKLKLNSSVTSTVRLALSWGRDSSCRFSRSQELHVDSISQSRHPVFGCRMRIENTRGSKQPEANTWLNVKFACEIGEQSLLLPKLDEYYRQERLFQILESRSLTWSPMISDESSSNDSGWGK